MTATKLTRAQCQQFEQDGYLCPLRALDDQPVTRLLKRYNDYAALNQDRLQSLPANRRYEIFSQTHFALPWVYEIVRDACILDTMESLLGPNILAWDTGWFSKMPGDRAYVSWHQDGTYWNLNPPTVVTAWVALTPSQPWNGCLRVVPGTHKRPAMPQRETYKNDNMLSRGQEIAVEVDEKQAVDLALQPGEMSLHHIWIVHGSQPNTSPTPRIGIAIRYTRPEVKQDSPFKPFALLARGEDKVGNFEILSPPADGNLDEQLRRHKEIVERLRANIMKGVKK